MKNYSNISQKNIHYYLKLRIPIMLRQFLKILSQNRDDSQTHCIVRYIRFHFACRKWISENSSLNCFFKFM